MSFFGVFFWGGGGGGWGGDALPERIQRSDSISHFIKHAYHRYAEYRNLLDP